MLLKVDKILTLMKKKLFKTILYHKLLLQENRERNTHGICWREALNCMKLHNTLHLPEQPHYALDMVFTELPKRILTKLVMQKPAMKENKSVSL